MKHCPSCSKEFVGQGRQVFCSTICKPKPICAICNKTFVPSRRGLQPTCSLTCGKEYVSRRKRIRKTCPTCNEEFYAKRRKQQFCSRRCTTASLARPRKCYRDECTNLVRFARNRYCSQRCSGIVAGKSKKKRAFEGKTKTDNSGYIWVYTKGTWKLQHRVVMEEHLGRKLARTESVHHKNGVRIDNRIENLEVWTRHQPTGIRASDYHCPGCNCKDLK